METSRKNTNGSYSFFYKFALVLLFLLIAFLTTINLLNYDLVNLVGDCALRNLFGLYCPACGGTRAFVYMIHGHFLTSLYYHPFVLYSSVLYIWFIVSYTLQFLTHNKVKCMHFKMYYVYIGFAIIFIQWFVKTIALVCFHTPLI